MDMVIASLEDIEIILPLFLQYRDFYQLPSCIEESREFLSQRLMNHQSVILLSKNDDELLPCGFAQLYPSYNSLSLKPMYILHDLFVRPSSRGCGHGARLLDMVKKFAFQQNVSEVILQTAKDNLNAQSLYESHGFVRDVNFYSYYLSEPHLPTIPFHPTKDNLL
jgi:ribosomal protein S18 acetylase RimI-like enzyme